MGVMTVCQGLRGGLSLGVGHPWGHATAMRYVGPAPGAKGSENPADIYGAHKIISRPDSFAINVLLRLFYLTEPQSNNTLCRAG
jgi:hypothetical protein